jgi:hypothetical protein
MHALNVLRKRGLSVAVEGDRLLVTPAEKIDDEMRAFIRERKPELIDVARQWEILQAAINACCATRREADGHRMALLADCLWKEPEDWAWWINYFRGEELNALRAKGNSDG